MMSSNVVLFYSNNCSVVLEPAICEDLDLHVAIFFSVLCKLVLCHTRVQTLLATTLPSAHVQRELSRK